MTPRRDTPKLTAGQVISGLLALLVGLFLAGLTVVGLAWGLGAFFSGIPKGVAAALATGLVTILGSVLTITQNRRSEQRQEIERRIRKKRLPIYEKFLRLWFSTLVTVAQAENVGESADGAAIDPLETFKQGMEDFAPDLSIWGSDDVIKEWAAFRMSQSSAFDKLFEFEQVVRAMRKDFGHKNKKLEKGYLLSLFVNDMGDVLAGRTQVVDPQQAGP